MQEEFRNMMQEAGCQGCLALVEFQDITFSTRSLRFYVLIGLMEQTATSVSNSQHKP